MPGQQVDRAAFPEFGEGDLRVNLPSVLSKAPRHKLAKLSVGRVDQPIEVAAPPPDDDHDVGVEDREDPAEPPQRQPVKSPPLHI